MNQAIEGTQFLPPGVSPDSLAPTQPISTRFSPGQVVQNRFLIIRFVGRGGMGEVYEAQDLSLKDLRIALKTILPASALAADSIERLKREVILARQITHPNVCPIYDICDYSDSLGQACFFTMKLLPGETLAARLDRNGALPHEEAISITRQVAAALQAAHREQIVHRDIKPSNIMVEASGQATKAIVTDFGLARKYDNGSDALTAATCVGTPGYLAPEVYRGHPATTASDLYAFGVVMHLLFTGQPPLSKPGDLSVRIARDLWPGGVPSLYLSLAADCLSLDPRKRSQAFEQALPLLGLQSAGSSPLFRPPPKLDRRHFLGIAASSACAISAAAFWKWDDWTEPILHPLPKKRFVALLTFPASDSYLQPMLVGIMDAIESELSRAEAFDHNLLVIGSPSQAKEPSQLKEISSLLGANLVMAASASPAADRFRLSLEILDPSLNRLLRRREVLCAFDQMSAVSERAVRTAASLLGVSRYIPGSVPAAPATTSTDALKAFQLAEALKRQPNDSALDKAIEQYKVAIEQDDHYSLAHARLAVAYCRYFALHGDPAALQLAQANAETALALNSGSAESHLALGWVHEHRGQIPQALTEMGKALALDPADPKTLIWESLVYARLNRFSEAEDMARRVIRARPNYWLAYNQLGFVLQKSGKYREALEAFRAASLANPQNALAAANLGEMCLKLGQSSEAMVNLQRSLALKPSGFAARTLAQALRSQGKYPDALAYARKAVEYDPSEDENWLELGDSLESTGDRKRALEAYLRASQEVELHLQTNASDGAGWMLLALYEAKSAKPKAATLALIGKAQSLGASDLDSQFSKARVLELNGQRQEALSTLAECFRLGATKFQAATVPEFKSLRRDPRFTGFSDSFAR